MQRWLQAHGKIGPRPIRSFRCLIKNAKFNRFFYRDCVKFHEVKAI